MYVVIHHYFGGGHNYHEDIWHHFFAFGGFAVDLFFILSGFILCYVYLPHGSSVNWSSYWRARVARILPLYYLTTLLMMPVAIYSFIRYGVAYVGIDYPINVVLNLLMVSGIVDGFHRTFNSPAWSISIEFFCYFAIFPLLIYLKSILESRPYKLIALVILTSIFIYFRVTLCDVRLFPLWDSSYLVSGKK